jgi:hypothetical protein
VRRIVAISVFVSMVTAVLVASPSLADPGGRGSGSLDAYTAQVTADQLRDLARLGHDVADRKVVDANTSTVDLVLSPSQRDDLVRRGMNPQLTRVNGKTLKQLAAEQAVNGYTVWRSYDEAGGIRDQMYAIAANNPQVAKLVKLGTTIQGREILAVKLTQGARGLADGSRPAVLYSSTQHAREWISTEVNRRLMNWYVDRWRANDRDVRKLLEGTELWFMLVANPDGYQYTFDTERLWRKNLRDNDGNGQITVGDGVDPNRNFPNHWGYDNEGSSSITSSETYRGTGPVSEAETAAMKGLLDRVKFSFQVNYHSNGQWLLYPEGWQIGTPTADDPIYFAMSGNLDRPAIEGFHPGLSSDVLYVTNGETTDYAHAGRGTLAWTPELSAGCPTCGFVFPDDDALVQQEFERNLPFARSVADSAATPDNPKSVLGLTTKPFYLESEDPYKRGLPGANLKFTYSYGDPQTVAVNAKRSLGAVTAKWKVNGGAEKSTPTTEWKGDSYTPAGVYYHQVRGVVTGTSPGDSVEVWFEGGGQRSESFTYQAVSETGNKVVVVAAEDYTGASPAQTPGLKYAQYYVDALKANGIDADVYDVDARGRIAPDQLGVLSHYQTAVWYPGDDIVTRKAGAAAGNADRLALDEMFEFRAYLNEGGKVLYTGDRAGDQYTGNVGNQLYDPKGEINCAPLPAGTDARRCLLLRGSGDGVNDVLQYWFGAYTAVLGDGLDENGDPFPLRGIDEPFSGLTWGLNGPFSANNQHDTESYLATSGVLPPDQFKQFESWPSAQWDKPGGPYAPHTGDQYVYSQIADVTYKRLTRTITVPAGGASMSFWTSYNTEEDWDYVFVEAHTVGQDNWTTLPDANGNTSTDTGMSCPAPTSSGWRTLHPWLDHYQTRNPTTAACTPTGTTGSWNAATGDSHGWQQWSVNLGAYANQQVEVSIAYVSDWATQGLGAFVDDVVVSTGEGSTSFEAGLDGWAATGPPPGSAANANNWIRTDSSSFPVGAAITTPRTIIMGFGVEGISTPAERAQVMGRAMGFLLP